MKRLILVAFILAISLLNLTFADTPDLVLQSEITTEYVLYLVGQEAQYFAQILFSGDADDTPTMKAHMGLTILQFAWTHVDGDTLFNDIEPLFDNIEENINSVVDRVDEDIIPILESESQSEFFDSLVYFFNSGTYPDFRDSLEVYFTRIGDNFELIGEEFDDFGSDMDLYSEYFGDHLDAVVEGTADFEFSLKIMGSEYEDTVFVFSRHFFNSIDSLESMGETIGDPLDDGFIWIDSVMTEPGGDVIPGVEFIRTGLDNMYEMYDSVRAILTSQPFAPLEIDVSAIDSIQRVIEEVDTLLGGKEYTLEPEDEGKVIKPLAILQNLPDGEIVDVYKGFYRSGSPAGYTFGGIFPYGVTEDMLTMILPDVVLNTWDDDEAWDLRMSSLKEEWLAFNPMEPDHHLGVAFCLLYELLTDEDFFNNFEMAFEYMDEGRIDSLTFHFDWDSFNRHDEIAEIRAHLDEYIEYDDPTNFNILIKYEEDTHGPYEIGTESEFEVISVAVPQVAMATEMLSLVSDGLTMISDVLISMYEEMGDMFVMDLDPSVLNFSEVESDSDLILLLESSNPDFMSITPYGIEQFHEMGEWLEQAFEKLGTFYDQMIELVEAMSPYEEDFNMNSAQIMDDMENSSYLAWEMYNDFAFPDSTIDMDGERVNFSAWFDDPPVSMLLMWKYYVFGIDSSLGGLFPDRMVAVDPGKLPVLPRRLHLYPAYPNPFNPATRIEFDIPKSTAVKLSVVNIKGELVEQLINTRMKPGKKRIWWNAEKYPTGIYFTLLEADGYISVQKITLLK